MVMVHGPLNASLDAFYPQDLGRGPTASNRVHTPNNPSTKGLPEASEPSKRGASTEVIQHDTIAHHRQLPGHKIFMAGPWVPRDLVEANLEKIGGMEVHMFNDTTMTESVKLIAQQLEEEAGVSGAWEAYKMLRPWAYRVDLWRLMILWSEGGVYLDAKMEIVAPLSSWATLAEDEELGSCTDKIAPWRTSDGHQSSALWNAVMSARKGSPLLLDAIRLIIKNVDAQAYGLVGEEKAYAGQWQSMLAITGPILLGFAARNYKHRISCTFNGGLSGVISKRGGKLLQLKQEVYDNMKTKQASTETYNILFDAGKVYCSTPVDGEDRSCKMFKST